MATNASEVFDLFLSHVNDYNLTALYQSSGSAGLNTFLTPWLLNSIDDFDLCSQSLAFSTTTQNFTETLTQQHMNILANIMVKYWLEKEVMNISQMRLKLQDRDYRTYAEANNLKEKRELLIAKQEEIDRLLQKYGYRTNDWTSWEDQIFSA